jgi:hypothetical protein
MQMEQNGQLMRDRNDGLVPGLLVELRSPPMPNDERIKGEPDPHKTYTYS